MLLALFAPGILGLLNLVAESIAISIGTFSLIPLAKYVSTSSERCIVTFLMLFDGWDNFAKAHRLHPSEGRICLYQYAMSVLVTGQSMMLPYFIALTRAD
jgi:hypothetical protein